MRWRALACALVLIAVAACSPSGEDGDAEQRSPLYDQPLPPSVDYRQDPEGVAAADPAFEALPGARAMSGYLGGSAYRIEVPDEWNGRLVMWMHGFEDFAPMGQATAPDLRRYLIEHGFAWAGSSYSSTGFIPDRGADETAALWDLFVSTVARPTWTYGFGLSMGGWSAHLVAERYSNRFDGVLGLCGSSGTTRGLGSPAAQLIAGAYAAGVRQEDVERAQSIGALVDDTIRPALRDPEARRVFEAVLVELTGGPRPFAVDGLRATQDVNWRRAVISASARVMPPREEPYRFHPGSGLDEADFNATAITPPFDPETFETIFGDMATTGSLRIPVLTMHSTGDGQSPIIEAVLLHDLVERADASRMLVQRVYRDAGHCGFSAREQEDAFEALVRWVEHGERPAGTDLTSGDLTRVDGRFEEYPRLGTAGSADDTIDVSATATLDGQPLEATFLGAIVLDHGLSTPCNAELPAVVGGQIDLKVFNDKAIAGCAAPERSLVLWTFVGETRIASKRAIPLDGADLAGITVEFDSDRPQGAAPASADYYGEVVDEHGERIGPGHRIEVRIASARCAVTSTRRDSTFIVAIAIESVPGCTPGRNATVYVDGAPTDSKLSTTPGRGSRESVTVVHRSS
ncbi:MAG: hypothetical protein ACT4OV_11560 [Microthrixaceae bacterium]